MRWAPSGKGGRLQAVPAFVLAAAVLAGSVGLHDPRAHQSPPASNGPAKIQGIVKSKSAPDSTCAACLLQLQTRGVDRSVAVPLATPTCRSLLQAARACAAPSPVVLPGSPRAPPSLPVAIG